MSPTSAISPGQFTSFGALLKYLRRRAGLTQHALSIAVGYTAAHLSRFEHDHRAPDAAIVAARFVPALGLEGEPAWAARLLELAGSTRTLPAAAAPLLAPASPPPSNLPAPLTTFVGREHELAQIQRRLADPAVRLVTLTGAGGIGKTRLAQQAATDQAAHFADGAWFVALAPVPAPETVVFALGDALALRFAGQEMPQSQLLRHLRRRQTLLVLDNFEHVLPASALVAEILEQAPGVKVLVTSRERLNLYGEWVVEVEGLAVPTSEPETSEQYSAVALFVDSGRRAHSGFALGAGNRAAVRRICHLVEGMPLALELAAAWLPVLSAGEITQEIERGLSILATTSGAVAPRHRSLRAVFDHSASLMTERERLVFRRLSVFRGGFTREAAEAVAGADLHDLARLSAKALIRRASSGRYEIHELLRQYGQEQLAAASEAPAVRDHHLAYFVSVGQQAEAALIGPGEYAAITQLTQELDNIRAALSHTLAQAVPAGLELAGTLERFWPRRNLQEGLGWLQRLLEQPAAVAGAARAKALLALSSLYWQGPATLAGTQACAKAALEIYRALDDERGAASALFLLAWSGPNIHQARAHLAESLALFRRHDDKFGQAEALWCFGNALDKGEPDKTRVYLETSLALCREIGWISGTCIRLTSLGYFAMRQCDFDQAEAYVAESMTLVSSVNDDFAMSEVIGLRAELALRQGHYDQAEADYEALIAENLALGQMFGVYWGQSHLARVAVAKGQLARAHALFVASLRAFQAGSVRHGVAYACEGLAGLCAVQAQPEAVVRLIAWADRLREVEDDCRAPVEQLEVDRVLTLAHAQLDGAAIIAAQARGRAMTEAEVVEYALGLGAT